MSLENTNSIKKESELFNYNYYRFSSPLILKAIEIEDIQVNETFKKIINKTVSTDKISNKFYLELSNNIANLYNNNDIYFGDYPNNPSQKKIVSFDGINGSGKTTYINLMQNKFNNLYYSVPRKKLFNCIERRFLEETNLKPDSIFSHIKSPIAESLFFASDLYYRTIINTKNNYVNLLDRGILSFLAYQYNSLSKNNLFNKKNMIDFLNFLILGLPKIEKTFFLDVDFSTVKNRISIENSDENSFNELINTFKMFSYIKTNIEIIDSRESLNDNLINQKILK